MPRLLALDTTSELGSLALVDGGELVEQVAMRSRDGYGHLIFGEIDALLARHGWRLGQIDGFCAASGPGSFTGIRVGMAAVRGLSEALSKPALAVSTLQAMAWHGTAGLRAVVIDARREEIYGGVYACELEPAQAETVTGLAEWLAALPPGEPEVLCRDASLAERLAGILPAHRARVVPAELAEAVARVAAARLSSGGVQAASFEANYVRRSDAEMFWREW
jgi:tRNA threonylcarbamoyladenosine biosynthesis protein TsaB